MEAHPTTPFPAKRRPVAASKPTRKVDDKDRTKPSTQTATLARPKRVFGVTRNTNIPQEKLLLKPWKPSGNNTSKSSRDSKTKIGIRKSPSKQHACLQDTAMEAESSSSSINKKSLGRERTPPVSLLKEEEVVEDTPYQSAENCSKCRFDKLETSRYWIGQIKIAESVGRHLVSAAFFRLASECNAQPFRSLQSELKHYLARHNSVSSNTQWIDLCQLYGLPSQESKSNPWDLINFDAVLVEQEDINFSTQTQVNSETVVKDGECFGFDFIDNPSLGISDNDTVTNTDIISIKEAPADVRATPNSSSQGSFGKNKTTGVKSFPRNVSAKNKGAVAQV